MTDMDSILSIVENPTRRKILQAIVREPHYPLQLSRELGISQQAIMKNLNLMEKEGMVVSRRQSSDRGPDRILYSPSSEFTITIDMRNNMFEVHMMTGGDAPRGRAADEIPADRRTNDEKRLEEVRARISSIDRQISEFDKRRSELMMKRNDMINEFLNGSDVGNLDYEHRELLYDMLNRPNWSAEEISKDMGFNESHISKMIDEVLEFYRND